MQHDTHHGHGASHDRAHGARGEHSEHGDALAAPASHAGRAGHVAKFRRLFWIMLVLAVPAVGFNEMFAHVIGYHLTEAGWVPWVSTVLGAVIYFWGGWPFLTGVVSEIRSRKPGMMLLIGLAITVAFVDSWGGEHGAAESRAELLVGIGAAGRDHAGRALDRNAFPCADHLGVGFAGGAAAG